MSASTPTPRTRLVITQKGRDVRRVAASIAAYALIGVAGAAGCYALCLGMVIVGEAVTGR